MTVNANILQPLIDVFESVLKLFHDSAGFGWGASIIALTVVVRAAILPLAVKQYRSMQALQRIAPQIKALQTKYRDDKQRLQQETMKFYSENKVNPFASCLPLVMQMPVFFALFYLLREDLREDICGQIAKPCSQVYASGGPQEFLFIPDITDKATGGVLVALIVLYVGSQLISSLLMMTSVTDRNQKIMFLALPFVFIFFVFSFPAGLLTYWITTNVWTIGQQQFLKRVIGKGLPPIPVVVDAAPAVATATGVAGTQPGGRSKAPPPPPRRKRKRSGRRR